MGSVSTRLDDETEQDIREIAEERDESIAAVVRSLIEKGRQHEQLKAENERLKQEKRKLIQQLDENQEMVEYLGEEQRLLKKREKRKNAPIWKRAKWWVFGDQTTITDDDMNNR